MQTPSLQSSTTPGAVERLWVSMDAAQRAVMGVTQQMILVTTYSCYTAEMNNLHAITQCEYGVKIWLRPRESHHGRSLTDQGFRKAWKKCDLQ